MIALVVAFFLSPILVEGLGNRCFGIWSLVESILAYLMLLDLGVAASVVRYVAKYQASADRANLNRVFNTSFCIFAAAGALALALVGGFAYLGLGLFTIPADLRNEARWLLLLLGVNLALGLPLSVFPAILEGLGRYPARTAIRTLSLLVRSGLLLVVIQARGGLMELGVVLTAASLLEYLVQALVAWLYLPELRWSPTLADWATFRLIRGYSLNAFLIMIAGRISFQTDALVIGMFLLPEHITYFVIGARLVEYAKDSLRALTTVLTPAASTLEAQGELAALRHLLVNGSRTILWLVLPVQLGMIFLGKPFLALWMGPSFAEYSYPVLLILAVPLGLLMSQSVAARILYGMGQLSWYVWLALLEAAANLAVSLALIRSYGIVGVALGTALPNIGFSLALAVHVCRVLELSLARYAVRAFLRPLAAAVFLAAFWATAIQYLDLDSWPLWVATGALGTGVYLLLAIFLELGPASLLTPLRRLGPRLSDLQPVDTARLASQGQE
jgi:O-antigen/teichoic acid export membrane protein